MARDYAGTTSDFLQAGSSGLVDLTGFDITVASWVRRDTATQMGVCTKWGASGSVGQYTIELSSGGAVTWGTSNGVSSNFVSTAGTFATDVWAHVAGRQNSGGKQVFLNGVQGGTTATASSMASAATLLTLGKYVSLGAPFNGKMAMTAIWDVALTDQQIMALAKGVSPFLIRPDKLRFYCPQLGTGSPERDYGIDKAHMTINGSVPAASINPPAVPFSVPTSVGKSGGAIEAITDAATINLLLQPSGVDIAQYVESATVLVDLQPSGVELFEHAPILDSATVYLDLSVLGGECYSTFSAAQFGEGEANLRWYASRDALRWTSDPNLRWTEEDISLEAIHC